MLSTDKDICVYLACGYTDMRKSINGLSVMIYEGLNLGFYPANFYPDYLDSYKYKTLEKENPLQFRRRGFLSLLSKTIGLKP